MGMAGTVYAVFKADTTSFTRKMQGLGKSAGAVGKKLTTCLTAPLLLIAGAAVAVAAAFEQKLTNAFSVTGSTSDEVKGKMEDLARAMGESTVFSAGEAADAMYYMASAGWKAEEMTVALEDTLNLAAATQEDLAFTTNTVVSALNMFGKSAGQAGEVADIYANAISNSQATLNKLGTSMAYVGPIANSLGYSIEDTTAALMGLYNKGIDASMAGTGLRMSLMKLLKPTGSARKALKEMGLTIEDLNPQTNSLTEIVRKLESANMDAKQAVEIFGARASAAMINLVSTGGDALDSFKDKLGESGTSARMAAQQIDTLKGQWKLLTSALSEVAIQFGAILLPILKDLINNALKPFVQWLGSLSEGTKKIIVLVAAFAAGIGPLLMMLGKLAVATSMAAGPLGILIAGLALIATKIPGIVSHFQNLKKSVYDFEKETQDAVVPLRMFWKEINTSKEASREFANAIQRNHGDVTKVMGKLADGTLKHSKHLQASYNIVRTNALKAKEAAKEAAKAEGKLNAISQATKKSQESLRLSYTLVSEGVDAYCDNLIEVAKIKGELTEERAAEIEKIREEKTGQDLLYEAYNNIITALKTRTNLTPKLISQLEDRKEALEALIGTEETHTEATEAAIEAADEWKARLEELGLRTIPEKATATRELNSDLDKLHQMYQDGKLDLEDYEKAVAKVREELDDLANKSIGETAIPAFRDMSGALDLAVGEMTDRIPDVKTKFVEEVDIMSTRWGGLITDIGTSFGNLTDSLLDETTTFKDAWIGLLDDLKASFRGIIADMVKEWVIGFVAEIKTGAKEAGDAASTLAGGTASLGTAITSLATGIASILPAIAEGIAAAAKILVGALPDIIAIAAVALAIYAAFLAVTALFSSISGGGGGIMDATNRELHNIWEECRNNLNNTRLMVKQLDTLKQVGWTVQKLLAKIRDTLIEGLDINTSQQEIDFTPIAKILATIKKTGWKIFEILKGIRTILESVPTPVTANVDISRNNILNDMRGYLKNIRKFAMQTNNQIAHMVSILSNMSGYQTGGIAWTPQLATLAEHGPEIIIPLKNARQQIYKGEGAGVTINYSPQISAMDSQDVYQFMSGKGKDALMQILRGNVGGFTKRVKMETERY